MAIRYYTFTTLRHNASVVKKNHLILRLHKHVEVSLAVAERNVGYVKAIGIDWARLLFTRYRRRPVTLTIHRQTHRRTHIHYQRILELERHFLERKNPPKQIITP